MPTESTPSTVDQPESAVLVANAEQDVAPIGTLLDKLDKAATTTGQGSDQAAASQTECEVRLAENRLGMVSALFTSLRYRSPSTASHSLRVAFGCSRWAAALGMPDRLRTQLEAAALLHDIGKIAVPDNVLMKPGRLTGEELLEIDASHQAAQRILMSAGVPANVVEGVVSVAAWYDGSHRSVKLSGDQMPVISRMIAIVDAFDSMTTDQVYRPARSQERAVATLFEGAGTQFEPELVASFAKTLKKDQNALDRDVSSRWVTKLEAGVPWESNQQTPASVVPAASPQASFEAKLVENMQDAVLFIDSQLRIVHWNNGAVRMTGIGAEAACNKVFTPDLLQMTTPKGDPITERKCPIRQSLSSRLQVLERVVVVGRSGKTLLVDVHVIPVLTPEGTALGTTMLLRDISSEASLEERCLSLQDATTKDPMTQVANRAEFDRMLIAIVDAHQQSGLPCSLIMADIDHFKNVNDTYGHQAGDEVILSFASQMKTQCRSGDLVARYGGEEFAILCVDCTNADAAKRADQIRKQLAETGHSELGGGHVTASFGVTELQTGDTPESMLRRADRGLLQAKEQGRNQVVQLGDGMNEQQTSNTGWFGVKDWFLGPLDGRHLIDASLVTNVPVELAVEKLKGFIADRQAKILKAELDYLRLEVTDVANDTGRIVTFIIDLNLSQDRVERTNSSGLAAGTYVQTSIEISIRPKRDRDRRKGPTAERARLLLGNLKSYLMARDADEDSAS